jgi:hypothetical protein
MPDIGEVQRMPSTSHKAVWHACENCGATRWVLLRKGLPQSRLCYRCGVRAPNTHPKRGPDNPRWRGGRKITPAGYVAVRLGKDDPLYKMVGRNGYVLEHRLVMARALGRCLATNEEVHHKNRDKSDNKLENLELLDKSNHMIQHHKELDRLLQENAALHAEVQRLKGLLNETTPIA